MSNSIFVPISRIPLDIDEVRAIVQNTFKDFGRPLPAVSFENKSTVVTSLIDRFILIRGDGVKDQCWVSLNEIGIELSENPDFLFTADIKTRGSWIFFGNCCLCFL